MRRNHPQERTVDADEADLRDTNAVVDAGRRRALVPRIHRSTAKSHVLLKPFGEGTLKPHLIVGALCNCAIAAITHGGFERRNPP
ncbi:MAG: hypothetical protein NVS3B20_02420 [Polyangiales bacterium]